MNAIFKKELRDAARWSGLGLVFLVLLMFVIGLHSNASMMKLSRELFGLSFSCSLLFALLLSLVTFLKDERESARSFLVHRGVTLDRYFHIRVAAGMLVYFVTTLIPIAIAAIYLACIGPDYAPVSAWQAVPSLVGVLFNAGFYFAGVLLSCRPSHWFGTRTIPLATAALVGFCSWAALEVPSIATAVVLALGGLGLSLLISSARFAFVCMPARIAPTSKKVSSYSLGLVFLLASMAVEVVLVASVAPWFDRFPKEYATIAFSAEGTPWLARRKVLPLLVGEERAIPIVPMAESESEGIVFSTGEGGDLASLIAAENPAGNGYYWDMLPLAQMGGGYPQMCLDHLGYVLVYEFAQNGSSFLSRVVGSDRVTQANEPRGLPFGSTPVRLFTSLDTIAVQASALMVDRSSGRLSLPGFHLIDRDGVYRVDLANSKIERVIERKIEAWGQTYDSDPWLVLFGQGELAFYRPANSKLQPSENRSFASQSGFSLVKEVSVPSDPRFLPGATMFIKDIGHWSLVDQRNYVTRSVDSQIHSYSWVMPKSAMDSIPQGTVNDLVAFAAPACMSIPGLLANASTPFSSGFRRPEAVSRQAIVFVVIGLVLSGLLSLAAANFRGLSRKQQGWWFFAGALFGMGTVIAIIALYQKVFTVDCWKCKGKRRVEQESCNHCGAEWEPRQLEGIEIYESATDSVPLSSCLAP